MPWSDWAQERRTQCAGVWITYGGSWEEARKSLSHGQAAGITCLKPFTSVLSPAFRFPGHRLSVCKGMALLAYLMLAMRCSARSRRLLFEAEVSFPRVGHLVPRWISLTFVLKNICRVSSFPICFLTVEVIKENRGWGLL